MSNIQQHNKSAQNDGNANNISNNSSNNNSNNITNNTCDNQQTTTKTLEDTLLNGNDATTMNGNYQQKHLEDWLNATMKASPKTFSVSSAEFLDGARSALNSNGIGPSMASATPLNMFRMNPTQVSMIEKGLFTYFLQLEYFVWQIYIWFYHIFD